MASLVFDDLSGAADSFAWVMLIGAATVGLMSLTELFSSHTTNAAAAMHHMTKGEYATEWWTGQFLAVAVPLHWRHWRSEEPPPRSAPSVRRPRWPESFSLTTPSSKPAKVFR